MFGRRIITSPHLTERKMVQKPTFGCYEWARRWVPLYRFIRAWYIRLIRRRWQQDESNWEEVPMKAVLKMKDGTLVVHPAMKRELEESLAEKSFDYFKDKMKDA